MRASIGLTPYEFEYTNRPILPIKLRYPTWSIIDWDDIPNEASLIVVRARLLKRRDEDIEEARSYLRRMRERNMEYYNSRGTVRESVLKAGQLVLLYRS